MNFTGRTSQGILLSLSISLAATAQTALTDDSFASSATPKTNYGGGAALIVTAGSNTYLRFSLDNLAGTSSNVTSAYLLLYVDTVQKTGTIDVYAVNGPWSENGITFNTAPPLGSLLLSGVSIRPIQTATSGPDRRSCMPTTITRGPS